MSRKFQRTRGAHLYRGKRAGRGARLMSKIHRGIEPSGTMAETFKKIKEQDNREGVIS